MMGWFRALMPKEDKFFDLFDAHAALLVEAAEALRSLLATGDPEGKFAADVHRLEQRADDVFRDVLLAVRRSFITPFDRGDINDLITAMDDAIDQMRKTTKSIDLFEMRTFEENMVALGDVIVESAKLAAEAVRRLRKMQAEAARLHVLSEKITRLEERSDELHDSGLKALFRAHGENQAMNFVIGADVYGHLERVVDRIEDVGKYVNSIVVEHL
jgi:predicted phosphate transport protein (TIGR00153 family)